MHGVFIDGAQSPIRVQWARLAMRGAAIAGGGGNSLRALLRPPRRQALQRVLAQAFAVHARVAAQRHQINAVVRQLAGVAESIGFPAVSCPLLVTPTPGNARQGKRLIGASRGGSQAHGAIRQVEGVAVPMQHAGQRAIQRRQRQARPASVSVSLCQPISTAGPG